MFAPMAGMEPEVGRPHMPGYGIDEAVGGALHWAWAVALINRVRNHTVATMRPGGSPHAMPVWGLWSGDGYGMSTAITSVKSLNLLQEPACAVTVIDGDDALVLEGRAAVVDVPDGFREAYDAKYGQGFPDGPIWWITPTVAFGFQSTDAFSHSATRWQF